MVWVAWEEWSPPLGHYNVSEVFPVWEEAGVVILFWIATDDNRLRSLYSQKVNVDVPVRQLRDDDIIKLVYTGPAITPQTIISGVERASTGHFGVTLTEGGGSG